MGSKGHSRTALDFKQTKYMSKDKRVFRPKKHKGRGKNLEFKPGGCRCATRIRALEAEIKRLRAEVRKLKPKSSAVHAKYCSSTSWPCTCGAGAGEEDACRD
jgi:hypothetical protein